MVYEVRSSKSSRQLFELFAGDWYLRDMTAVADHDGRLRPGRERVLRFFHGGQERGQRRRALPRVEPMQLLKFGGGEIHDPHVPIVAAQLHVAIGGQRAEVAGAQIEQRHIERAAAQIVHEHFHRLAGIALFGQIAERFAEGQRRGGRLVDDIQHGQAGHLAGIGGRLAARLIEVRRHGNHHFEVLPDGGDRILFQLLEDAGLDHFGMQLFAMDGARVIVLAHVALDEFGDRAGLERGGFFRLFADDHLGIFEQHHAGREQFALGVAGDLRPTGVVQIGDARIGRSQIDSDCTGLGHGERSGVNRD